MKCFNCHNQMKLYGEDTYYFFWKCPVCKKEKAELKEEVFLEKIKEIRKKYNL